MIKKYVISLVVIMMIILSGCAEKNRKKDKETFMQYAATDTDASESSRITLTCLSHDGDMNLDEAINTFNKAQTKYKIEKISYNGEEKYDVWLGKQFAAGNYPDIYDVTYGIGDMSVEQAVEKGLLENLNAYMEKEESIKKEDFIPSLYDAMCIDGDLYFCASSASISTLAVRGSEVQGMTGWNLQEFEAFVNDDKRKNKWLFNSNNKTYILNTLLTGCGDDFVDWENVSCSFDSQEFMELLKICNRDSGAEMQYKEGGFDFIEMIRSNEQLFVDEVGLNPVSILFEKVLFDGDVTFIGYPNSKKNGTFICFHNALAISKKSEHKEGAWEFIKWQMTERYQGERYFSSMEGSPSRKDVFESYIEARQAEEEYTDKYGNCISANGGALQENELIVEHGAIPEDIIEEYRSMVYNAEGITFKDRNIIDIIDEEVKDYFNGDKSVEEVSGLIQNRVTLYMNEGR